MKIKTLHSSQWARYTTRFGEIAISRSHRGRVVFIPTHTPVISVPVTRQQAAQGLREWRQMNESR